MSFHGNCPQCGTHIPQDRYETGAAICECGWTDNSPAKRFDGEVEKKTIMGMVVFCLALLAFYGHAMSWGSYAVAIPFVKLQQVTGTLSTQGYRDLADACIGLNKWSCARTAYLEIYTSNRDPQGLADLGHFEVRLGNTPAALSAYASYFKVGGKSGIASLEYGKVLETAGQADAAIAQYEESIKAREATLPIQATAGIVRILIKQGKYEQAYQRITDFHASAENAKGFLNTELAQLESTLSKQAGGKAFLKKTKQG